MRLSLPRVTRVLIALLIGLSLAYQASAAYRAGLGLNFSKSTLVPWLSLTPRLSWKYPWVYATATFAEQNLFTLAIAGATLLFGGRYLERAWGEEELARFVIILTLVPNLGSIAIQAGFLVTFKQLVPEHTVSLLRGAIRVRVKHFPAIFLLANTISGFLLFTDTAAILSWIGFLTAWTYLRFYQKRSDDLAVGVSGESAMIRGDASETFAFAYFWPDKIHAPIAAISDGVFNILTALGLCTPFSTDEVAMSTRESRIRADGGLPTVNRTDDSERRRALALQALNERLAAARRSTTSAPAPPVIAPPQAKADAEPNASTDHEQKSSEGRTKLDPEWSHEQP